MDEERLMNEPGRDPEKRSSLLASLWEGEDDVSEETVEVDGDVTWPCLLLPAVLTDKDD